MTIDELIEEIAKLPRWGIHNGHIRRQAFALGISWFECPIATCANSRRRARGERDDELWGNSDFGEAGLELGLDPKDIREIVSAADGQPGYDHDLRRRLLEALSLPTLDVDEPY